MESNHNSKFELSKLAVMHFSKKTITDAAGRRLPMPAPPLILEGRIVKEVTSHQYLGLHIDNKLSWNIQAQKTIEKGTKWALLMGWLAKSYSGLSIDMAWKLYNSVVLPKITYGADIYYIPPHRPNTPNRTRQTGSVSLLAHLNTVQQIAIQAVTRGLRTTPVDMLDAHQKYYQLG
ncbi:hypothetical protein BDQ17DRAFT_823915 [Cyathus striatus]|nr:hypothetical protein BDQ17DRAFT_823915 [Cyathus striatus]